LNTPVRKAINFILKGEYLIMIVENSKFRKNKKTIVICICDAHYSLQKRAADLLKMGLVSFDRKKKEYFIV